jgi:hypothetical protein
MAKRGSKDPNLEESDSDTLPLSPYDVVIRTFRQSTFARISEVMLMLRRTWTAA